MQAVEIYFQPPLAIARVGPSPQPMPNFRWATDRSLHGAHQTTIRPDVTLKLEDTGGLSAELEYAWRWIFRDTRDPRKGGG